jgi:hypothetical protein
MHRQPLGQLFRTRHSWSKPMTIRSTFVKGTIAAVTIATAAIAFSVKDNAAAAPLHYSGYAKKAKEAATMQSTSTQSGVTSTPNTPRNEGRQTRRQR